MKKISKAEFIAASNCIYAIGDMLWIKHSTGTRFTCSPLFNIESAIQYDDGVNVCQSAYADEEWYYVLEDDERKSISDVLMASR